jgi:hypothetical protein
MKAEQVLNNYVDDGDFMEQEMLRKPDVIAVMKLYAQQKCEEQIRLCYEACKEIPYEGADRESILEAKMPKFH